MQVLVFLEEILSILMITLTLCICYQNLRCDHNLNPQVKGFEQISEQAPVPQKPALAVTPPLPPPGPEGDMEFE